MAESRFRRGARAVRAAALALALAVVSSGSRAAAEVPAAASERISTVTLALRLPGPSVSASGVALPRPSLGLAWPVDPAPSFERRPIRLAPTLELSIETLRLFAGHSPRRFTPFIGWSTSSLGLRIRF